MPKLKESYVNLEPKEPRQGPGTDQHKIRTKKTPWTEKFPVRQKMIKTLGRLRQKLKVEAFWDFSVQTERSLRTI